MPSIPDSSTIKEVLRSLGQLRTREETATEFLRTAILRGIYRPGERLNQDVIAETLGLSRMPIRASLRTLATDGLVEFHPYKGAVVRVLTAVEIKEIYDLRILFEAHLIEEASKWLNPEVLAHLQSLVSKVRADQSGQAWVEHRHEFYDELFALAQLPRLTAIVAGLRREIGPYLLIDDRTPGDHIHGEVLEYRLSGDTTGAIEVLRIHLGEVSRSLQSLAESLQDVRE